MMTMMTIKASRARSPGRGLKPNDKREEACRVSMNLGPMDYFTPTPRIASPMDLERVGEVAGRVGRL